MKKFVSLMLVALVSCGTSFATDAQIEALSAQLVDKATAAMDAATAPEDMPCCEKPPTIRNWRLRSNLKDIRKIAMKVRDRAARGRGHTLVTRLKVKQIKANMRTCNFLVQNKAAHGLEAFPAAWQEVRDTIGSLIGEMCCGQDPAGDKSMEEEL